MILALAMGFVYFGFGNSLFLGFVFVCFFFFLRCVVVAKVERWLWPVVVVVGVADGRGVCGSFVGSVIYYFIVRNILFYCNVYIILLYCIES